MVTTIILTISIFALAMLYSSVGHAGASGYLAAMALVGLAPDEMKPTALVLNIFVASIGTYRFAKAGYFSWATLWPFVITSIPLATIGGAWQLPGYVYKPLVGIILVFASYNLIKKVFRKNESQTAPASAPVMPNIAIALLVGGGIGLLAGLTGTGGGIFLSPLLILLAWADPKRTAAVSVVFVLLNSISGLAGFVFSHADAFTADMRYGLRVLPDEIVYYLFAAIVGGVIGSGIGAKKITADSLKALLGVVLLIAALKMFITGWQDYQAMKNAEASGNASALHYSGIESDRVDQVPGGVPSPASGFVSGGASGGASGGDVGGRSAAAGGSSTGLSRSRSSRPSRILLKSPAEMT